MIKQFASISKENSIQWIGRPLATFKTFKYVELTFFDVYFCGLTAQGFTCDHANLFASVRFLTQIHWLMPSSFQLRIEKKPRFKHKLPKTTTKKELLSSNDIQPSCSIWMPIWSNFKRACNKCAQIKLNFLKRASRIHFERRKFFFFSRARRKEENNALDSTIVSWE